jgi:mannosyltransferase
MTTVQPSAATAAPPQARPRPHPAEPFGPAHLVVAGEVLLALVLGLIGLGRQSFFPDEAYSWSTVDRSFSSLVSVVVHKEAFQVLHSLLLWPVNGVSESSFALRLPSVLFFAATVPPVYALGKRVFDERTGLVAGLLLAVNAFALQYAQQARSYTMAMFFAAYAAVALVREVTAPTRWSRPVWVACSVAAVWSHGMAVFAIAAQVASLVVLPRDAVAGRRFLRSAILIGVLAAPVVVAPQLQLNRAEAFPAGNAPGLTTLRLFAWSFVGRSVFALVPYAIGGAIALWAAYKTARASGRSLDSWHFALPFLWLAFPPAFLLLYSFVDPIWVERYVTPSLPALVVLVAYGLTRVTTRRALAVVLALTVAAAFWGVVRWYTNPGLASFDRVVATLDARVQPGDVLVLTSDRSRVPMEFAVRDHARLRDALEPAYPDRPWGGFGVGDQTGNTLPARIADALPASHDRVWMVAGFYDPEAQLATSVRRMERGYQQTFFREYGGPIKLYLFERRGS